MATPTVPPDHTSDYYKAVTEADADAKEALEHIAAQEDEGKITTLEAAHERIELLERHLARCRRLRREHLGDQP